MQPTTTTVRLLYVTDRSVDRESVTDLLGFEEGGIDVAVAASVEAAIEELDGGTIDCILCAGSSESGLVSTVEMVRGAGPGVPILAFVGDASGDHVEAVLESGASDVVQSTPADVSPLLLRRRIDGLVDEAVRATRDRTRERFETILNTAVDPIYQLDDDGTIVAVNDAAVELTGYDRSALVGSHVSLVMDEEDIARGNELIEETLADGEQHVHKLEMELKTSDGEAVPCEVHIAVLEADGEFAGTVGVVRDISERRDRERQLRERDRLLENIGENVNDVVWVTDPEKENMAFASAAYEDIWGRSREAVLSDAADFIEGIHPEDRPRVERALERQREDPDSYDVTYRVVQPDGEIRWVHDRAFGVYEDDELVRIVGVAQDVTQRRRAQQRLRDERDMFAQGPAVLFKWKNDVGWPVEYVSENVTDLLGYTPEELKSGDIEYKELIHDEDLPRVTTEVEVNSDGSTERFSHEPYRVVRSDGEVRWVKDTTKILRQDGEITNYLGYLVDITERKEREQELHQLKEEYELMVETVGDVVYTLDEDYYFMSVNGAAEAVTGYTAEELEGAHISKVLSEEALQRGREYRQKVIDGEIETGSIELEINRADGSTTPVEFRYRALPFEEEFRGTAGVIRDVSERKRRERELQAERDLVERIFEASPVGVLVVDGDSTVTRVNERAAEILAVDRDDLTGTAIEERTWEVYGENGEPVPASQYPVRTVRETGESVYGWEAKYVPADGQEKWVSISAAPLIDDSGDVAEAVIAIEDVTERKEAQFELRAEKEFTEQLIDALDDVLYLFGEDGDFRRWNDTLEAVTGYTSAELAALDPSELFEGEDEERIEAAIEEVLATGSTTVEADLVAKDGERIPYEFTGARVTNRDGTQLVCGIGRDISDRKERENKIASQRDELAQLDRLNAVIRDVDQAVVGASTREEIERAVCERLSAAGRYTFALVVDSTPSGGVEAREWTETAQEFVDEALPVEQVDPEDSPALRALETGGTHVVRDVRDHPTIGELLPDDTPLEAIAAIPVTYEDQAYGVIAVYSDETGMFSERELSVLGELGDTVGYAIAAVQQREREATLTALYEATRALLGTDSQEEVSDVVVEVATDVLDLSAVGIFLFDDSDNALQPESATGRLLEFYGGTTEFGPGKAESVAWESYVNGEVAYYDDIREAEKVANPDTDARSTLVFPLGKHGVFVAASDEVGVLDDQRRQLVGLLAATAETALDRVAGQETLAKRDERLAERTEKLERFERLNTVLRDVAGVVRTASSRQDVEQALCDRLVDHPEFAFAWTGVAPPDEERVEPRSWAGDSGSYLDDAPLALAGEEPAARTASTGEPTLVENVTDHLRDSEWARTAVDRNYQSVLSVPLAHEGTTYGVVTVYATAPEAFDETTRAVLAELGELVAYGINVVETRQGILAEQVTELELRIRAPETFLNAVADLAEESVQYREITPENGDAARVLFELRDPPVEDVLALESEFVAVDSLTHGERSDQHLFRATLGSETVAATLLARGAIPTEVVASEGETRAVVRLPQQLDVREFLARVRESYPETELVSRQTVERQEAARETVRVALEEELTDRQREVLVTAYESGFFESPRQTTGAELAELLDVSQPTVTHHLREAQRRLFAELFDETL